MNAGKTRIVVALGGNALQSSKDGATAEAQLAVVQKTCGYLVDLIRKGYEIVIVHGNGPQVGRILLASETAKDVVPAMPFDVCGAMSQGYIGYHIQQALKQKLKENNMDLPVATIVTQVAVDKGDTAFQNPSKPIGPFYSEEQAKKLAEEKGYTVKEDAGRGWRRVVPSPKPVDILEKDTIDSLLGRSIVITCGGGGIPVVKKADGTYEGVAAVIDKDFAAEALAEHVNADVLLILTEVEHVAINFGKPNQENLEKLTAAEARKYMAEGQFAPGSMLPKVEAAVKFVEAKPGKRAIISSLYHAVDAIEGNTGTEIC